MIAPTATPLHLGPQDMAAMAAACCYGRPDLREPEREARMLAGLMQLDPPHLTLAEHARFTVQLPRPSYDTLEVLLSQPRPPLYRRDAAWETVTLGVNASQARQLLINQTVIGYRLLPLLGPIVPALLGDFSEEYLADPDVRLVPDEHLSPEHRRVFPSRSFLIRCSRAASHQLVRHRGISWEQRSQRQPNRHGSGFDFIWPPVATEPYGPRFDVPKYLADIEEEATDRYRYYMQKFGWLAEDARYLLPNATATTLIATAPMEAWRHFLRLRGERKAQSEIRFLAYQIRRALLADLPDAVEDLTVDTAGLAVWLEQETVP